MKIEMLTLCNQLIAAAANSIYQGIIVTALVALSLRALGRTNAATRHAVWFCTLLLLVALQVAHSLIVPLRVSEMKEVATVPMPRIDASLAGQTVAQDIARGDGMNSIPSEALRHHLAAGPEEPLDQKSDAQASSLSEVAASEAPRGPIGILFSRPVFSRPVVADGDERGNVASVSEPHVPASVSSENTGLGRLAERLINPVSLKLSVGSTLPRTASMLLLAFWVAIGSVRVFALLLQLYRIQKLKNDSLPPSAELSGLFHQLASRLAANRKVDLKVSPTHRTGLLLGFLHPVILLPVEERMEPAEVELVLRHELAHVGRWDDWANLVQRFILAVCFFHPAVWWISKRLTLEREIACDDHVLQQSRRPQAYALLLASLAARMQRGVPLLAPGSSNHKTQLKQRIDMILNKHRNSSPRLAKTWLALITSAAALIAVAIICSAPRIVLAQNESAPGAANAPSADAPSGGIVAVSLAPNAPDSDSADAVSRATPAPAAVGSGPKFKPGNPSALNVRTAVIVAPAACLVATASPSVAPTAVVPPTPPAPVVASVEPAPEPQVPRPPRPVRAPHPGNNHASLEERLERLERLVESLVNQPNPKDRADFHLKAERDGAVDRKEIARSEAFAKRLAELAGQPAIDPKQIEKIKELAEREAARAVDQARRATADAEKALKAERKLQAARSFEEGSQKQLQALRNQLEILEREREKLDHQIEQLEHDQEELDDQQDEDTSGSDTQPEESEVESPGQSSASR